ncbi:N-acetylglucosamine-6-phosphate deacetylase [Thermus oshimai]
MKLLANAFFPEGPALARLRFSERVEGLEPRGPVDLEAPWALPGFVDLHVHGGGGREVMEGEEGIRALLAFHLRHGTTALLATTVTAPLEDLLRVLEAARRVMARPGPGEARLLGVHLEGPFISPRRLGAQPPFARPPTLEELEALLASQAVRAVTLAPELPGMDWAIPLLRERGVRVQIGHTEAGYEETLKALERGASGFTHLFNAMPPLHHRAPGVVGAALERGRWAEVIPDGLHVHPSLLRLAHRLIPGLYAVTDAVAAAGMPDGVYPLGAHRVEKRGEGVWLGEGLAGSTLTMDRALERLLEFSFSLEEAVALTGLRPAAYLGLAHGLEPGLPADLVLWQGGLVEVYLGGRKVVG